VILAAHDPQRNVLKVDPRRFVGGEMQSKGYNHIKKLIGRQKEGFIRVKPSSIINE
jgi:hypothetical protein